MEMMILRRRGSSGQKGAHIPVGTGSEVEAMVEDLPPSEVRGLQRDDNVLGAAESMPLLLIEPVSSPSHVKAAPAEAEFAWGIKAVGASTSPFTGKGVTVAVIDTGIDIHHPWWQAQDWDDSHNRNFSDEETTEDLVGHGTHVAGIIKLVAPEVTLYNFKALGESGGSSFSLIRALYHVRQVNLEAGHTKIQGVNLSLGGPVPVKSYGCGWSPECQEANTLVNSGVVVCAAASNDGYKILATISQENDLEYFPTYMPLGISDPGNAEEVITVGSTHSEFPHRYGPSYFSSKGPTGDGRFKPDVLAPGERISSAWPASAELVALSGTSMATPHVSGAIAQFLSVKSEFIGLPRQVKQRLMASCVDLGRDRNFQGSGMIDVLNFIQHS